MATEKQELLLHLDRLRLYYEAIPAHENDTRFRIAIDVARQFLAGEEDEARLCLAWSFVDIALENQARAQLASWKEAWRAALPAILEENESKEENALAACAHALGEIAGYAAFMREYREHNGAQRFPGAAWMEFDRAYTREVARAKYFV